MSSTVIAPPAGHPIVEFATWLHGVLDGLVEVPA